MALKETFNGQTPGNNYDFIFMFLHSTFGQILAREQSNIAGSDTTIASGAVPSAEPWRVCISEEAADPRRPSSFSYLGILC
jgi:hypothetical protein